MNNHKQVTYSTKNSLNDLKKIKVKKPIVSKNDIHTNSKKHVQLAYRVKKSKLVIIIDDVHTRKQIEAIKKLKMKITPSIFPPYQLAKKSHLLAQGLEHYMVHLPMESKNKQLNTQTKTLMLYFSDERIVDRIMEIRQLFPNAKYINNHTGSVFTSNYKLMKKLYIALKLEGFTFIDSFTSSHSKVRQIAHEFGDVYVRRDIFIDNVHEIKAIHKQLQLAVKKAKKNGYAIAIGHPHDITMKALASSKHILKNVELVYIDDIYKRR